eukprot:maker-scaffold_5-snap-gene-8.7-mRNA-1 protein AED:0.03 eAED:0.03 QI:56/0.85/0.87/1/1/1/8/17/792
MNGATSFIPTSTEFITDGGVRITRLTKQIHEDKLSSEVSDLLFSLNRNLGCFFESAYEYPGRYSRWTMGFDCPILKIEFKCKTREFCISSIGSKGENLFPVFYNILKGLESEQIIESKSIEVIRDSQSKNLFLLSKVVPLDPTRKFSEEERSKQPSVFSVIRKIIDYFSLRPKGPDTKSADPKLGFYGAFGYDLAFQFDSIKFKTTRADDQRDLVLYLPDKILIKDKENNIGYWLKYVYSVDGLASSMPSSYEQRELSKPTYSPETYVSKKGDYAKKVHRAKEEFKAGRLFEAVLSQVFSHKVDIKEDTASNLFQTLKTTNPSPYMFLINFGEDEYLIGTSPEMFVPPVKGKPRLIETCPISGTISRGKNALEDAEQIRSILVNRKEESELTMCTDVDRNDKSRICKPGSVKVIGRRQIEGYSRLFHTVDHVIGELRDDMDGLDAFLVHMWAVTVTGAPKLWAMQFVENQEDTARRWYAGAVGVLGFDGSINTGMTLRTIRVKKYLDSNGKAQGVAEVRAGATLLFDSNPESEEAETELKASAMIETILSGINKISNGESARKKQKVEELPMLQDIRKQTTVLVIDHEDSFVNTLSNYFKQLSDSELYKVITMRHSSVDEEVLKNVQPDLVVLSPGPGTPSDFKISNKIDLCNKLRIPMFGVCLGLQGIVEHFGGKLKILSYPMHGKKSSVKQVKSKTIGDTILNGVPEEFGVGRYHSIYAAESNEEFPKDIAVLARSVPDSSDGANAAEIIMAVQHKKLPIAAVQFHPESIMTSPAVGMQMIKNAVEKLKY